MKKISRFLILFSLFSFAEAHSAQVKPAFNWIVSPYTVSPNTSSGAAFAISLSPRKEDSPDSFRLLGDVRLAVTFPYDRGGTSNENDLMLSFDILYMVFDPFFLGIRLGMASNQGIFRVPTVFYALSSRGYFLNWLFGEASVGRSSAGFNYAQLAVGVSIW